MFNPLIKNTNQSVPSRQIGIHDNGVAPINKGKQHQQELRSAVPPMLWGGE